jgi:hypothetical protein
VQKQKIIQAKDLLGRALSDGRTIQVEAGKGALPDDQLEQKTKEWATHTQAVISAAYGNGEAALFLSDAGFMAMGAGGPHTSEQGKLILIFLHHRLDRISALRSIRFSDTARGLLSGAVQIMGFLRLPSDRHRLPLSTSRCGSERVAEKVRR